MKFDLKTWIIIGLLAVIGCGPAAKLRRAERLINKAEELGAKWHVDTIQSLIRVPVPEILVKQVHHLLPGDTIRVEKERLKIEIRRIPGDTVVIEGGCLPDTVIQKVPTVVTKTIKASGGIRWWWLLVAAAAGMILGAVVRLIK